MKPEEIDVAAGYDAIIAALDAVYLKDVTTRAFCAFKEFYEFRRNSGDNFSDFIVEYEQHYHRVKTYGMELPEGVQAFFLLKAATPNARAIAKLEYNDIREKIMKIFGDPGVLDEDGSVPRVKEEVFYGQEYEKLRGKWRGSRGGYRGTTRARYKSQADRDNWNKTPVSSRGSRRVALGGGGGNRAENPVGYNGEILRCHECDSTKHLVQQCPHRYEAEDVNMNVHITLVNSKSDQTQKNLLVEALRKALLDTGCSMMVVGKVWLDEYLGTLPAVEMEKVQEGSSKSVFRFGDGIETKSLKNVTIPVMIGRKRLLMDVEVIENDIPLISKGAMKQIGMWLDFSKDEVMIDGEVIKLMCTTTGHYCLPVTITNLESYNVYIVLNLHCLQGLTTEEKEKKAQKLHRRFSHAQKEDKLRKLLEDSGCKDQEFYKCIEKCCDECELCQKYRRPHLRPVVSLPLAKKCNEVVWYGNYTYQSLDPTLSRCSNTKFSRVSNQDKAERGCRRSYLSGMDCIFWKSW